MVYKKLVKILVPFSSESWPIATIKMLQTNLCINVMLWSLFKIYIILKSIQLAIKKPYVDKVYCTLEYWLTVKIH